MAKKISRFATESHLIAKANKDKNFRKQLAKNPKATIEKELKVKFGAGAKITVIEETPKTWHIVIPQKAKDTESSVLVKDRGGIFYIVPKSMLSIFAVRSGKKLKTAARAWKAESPDVEGQYNGDWGDPWSVPTPCPCMLRG
jgi:hypothetical protein